MHKTIISVEVNRYEFHYKGESADLGGKMETSYVSMYYFAPGGTAVPAINPGNASVPGRPCEHASAAEYLQRDIANSNSNLHSNNIHCIILYYSSIELIQLWFLTWCVLVAGLLQSAVPKEDSNYSGMTRIVGRQFTTIGLWYLWYNTKLMVGITLEDASCLQGCQ